MSNNTFRFCGVFIYKGRLFVAREMYARGPGCMVFPPKELPQPISDVSLAREIEMALNDYGDLGRAIRAAEWDEINGALLEFFGAKSVRQFERTKKNVSIRLDAASQEVSLSGPNEEKVILNGVTSVDVARRVAEILSIKVTDHPTG